MSDVPDVHAPFASLRNGSADRAQDNSYDLVE